MILIIVQPYNNQIRITVFYVTTLSFCNYDIVFILKHGRTVTEPINQSHQYRVRRLATERVLQRDLVIFYEVDDRLLSRGSGRQ